MAPRCLISLHEKAHGTTSLDGEAIQAWVEWEMEAMSWRVPFEIDREGLEALVTSSKAALERDEHRLVHEGNWRRWGSCGGREMLRRYGSSWFSLLALRRWGPASVVELGAARALGATGTSDASKAPKTAFNGKQGR